MSFMHLPGIERMLLAVVETVPEQHPGFATFEPFPVFGWVVRHLGPGVRIVATPGHTPGHQSVVVEGGGERVVLAGQCVFRSAELREGAPSVANMYRAEWVEAGRDSVRRLWALGPATAQVSHDPEVVDIPG